MYKTIGGIKMGWDVEAKKFGKVAIVFLILVVVAAVIAKPEFVKNAGNEIIRWGCDLLGLANAPKIF